MNWVLADSFCYSEQNTNIGVQIINKLGQIVYSYVQICHSLWT
jgi:hypothetical protein